MLWRSVQDAEKANEIWQLWLVVLNPFRRLPEKDLVC
jgi:hypothetical protein